MYRKVASSSTSWLVAGLGTPNLGKYLFVLFVPNVSSKMTQFLLLFSATL